MKWVIMALVFVVFGLPLIVVVGIAALLGNSMSLGLGPPTNLGGVNPPAQIVLLDETVAVAKPPLVACQVPASLLLAQQYIESGYNPFAVSPAGAVGLSQFEPGTFAAYDLPVPPGGASPPSSLNATDSAYAEARYLCSLGIDQNPTDALIAYNCGNISPSCVVASSGYANEILSLAKQISTPKTVTNITKG
jgi:hypothetical protein